MVVLILVLMMPVQVSHQGYGLHVLWYRVLGLCCPCVDDGCAVEPSGVWLTGVRL